jgi:DNA-binding LytR/AlgR family response regulator
MPGINGIQAGRELRERYPDLIIVFVTGFIQYAREGYSVEAFRYLLKDQLSVELPACIRDIHKKLYEKQDSILVKSQEYSMLVPLQDIVFFEGTSQRHCVMHTRHDTVECVGKLSEFEEQLQNRGFLRIQRSYLVNMAHVNCMKSYYVYLSTGAQLKVSERSYHNVAGQYLRWKGKQL